MSNLTTREVRINGDVYEVREQPMRVLLPILEGETKDASVALMKRSVFADGNALGDAVLDLGFRDFQSLMRTVSEIHGLTGEVEDSKNAD